MHYLTVRSIKSAWVFIEDWAFAFFFSFLAAGHFAARESPPLGICHPGEGRGAWAHLKLTNTLLYRRHGLKTFTSFARFHVARDKKYKNNSYGDPNLFLYWLRFLIMLFGSNDLPFSMFLASLPKNSGTLRKCKSVRDFSIHVYRYI